MFIRSFLVSTALLFPFTQYSYGSQDLPVLQKLSVSIERTEGKINSSGYPKADLVTKAMNGRITTFRSQRNSYNAWATTYMHFLMYQLLFSKKVLDDPQKMVTIITDTLNDGKTSAIDHSTTKHVETKGKTGQAIQEIYDAPGYKTEISIPDLIEYFGQADQTIALDEDKQFAKLIYDVLQGENIKKISKKPILQFTFLDAIGYIFAKTVKYQTEKEKDHFTTSIVCTLGVNENPQGVSRPIKLKAIFHSKEPLETAKEIYFKTIYPVTNDNYDCDKDYTPMSWNPPLWLLRAQALQNSLSTWKPEKQDMIQALIRKGVEDNIHQVAADIQFADGYQFENYIAYFASLYHYQDKMTKRHLPLKDSIIDLLLRDGENKEATEIIKDMTQEIEHVAPILLLTVFNSREKDIYGLSKLKNTMQDLQQNLVITTPVGRGIAGENVITDQIGLLLMSLKQFPLNTKERANAVTSVQKKLMEQINKVRENSPKAIPLYILTDAEMVLREAFDDPEASYIVKDFCKNIHCINEAVIDFLNKNSQQSNMGLYDSVDDLLYLFKTINYIPATETSYQTLRDFPYEFTKQFIWTYYMRSTITEKDQINNKIKRLRDTAAKNPLALSLTNVMQEILKKDIKGVQTTVQRTRKIIQQMKTDFSKWSSKAMKGNGVLTHRIVRRKK